MPGLVHIVDEDASFLTAIERRLKQAGYEVGTYPSALDLLVNLPAESVYLLSKPDRRRAAGRLILRRFRLSPQPGNLR
jgi:hypothetical protein